MRRYNVSNTTLQPKQCVLTLQAGRNPSQLSTQQHCAVVADTAALYLESTSLKLYISPSRRMWPTLCWYVPLSGASNPHRTYNHASILQPLVATCGKVCAVQTKICSDTLLSAVCIAVYRLQHDNNTLPCHCPSKAWNADHKAACKR